MSGYPRRPRRRHEAPSLWLALWIQVKPNVYAAAVILALLSGAGATAHYFPTIYSALVPIGATGLPSAIGQDFPAQTQHFKDRQVPGDISLASAEEPAASEAQEPAPLPTPADPAKEEVKAKIVATFNNEKPLEAQSKWPLGMGMLLDFSKSVKGANPDAISVFITPPYAANWSYPIDPKIPGKSQDRWLINFGRKPITVNIVVSCAYENTVDTKFFTIQGVDDPSEDEKPKDPKDPEEPKEPEEPKDPMTPMPADAETKEVIDLYFATLASPTASDREIAKLLGSAFGTIVDNVDKASKVNIDEDPNADISWLDSDYIKSQIPGTLDKALGASTTNAAVVGLRQKLGPWLEAKQRATPAQRFTAMDWKSYLSKIRDALSWVAIERKNAASELWNK